MRTTTIKGSSMPKSELNAYSVGLMRLSDANIASSNFEREDIEHIGRCSINRKKVVIGKVGNFWCLYGRTLEAELKAQAQYKRGFRFKAYYIVVGKRVTSLHPSTNMTAKEYECQERSKPLHLMTTDEIFRAGGVGRLCKKREGKANSRNDIGRYKNIPGITLITYGY